MNLPFKLPGTLFLMAVFGFTFVSCGQDEESFGNQVTVSGSSLARKIEWVQNHRSSGTTYILEVSADEALSGYELTSGSNRNMTIILNGNDNGETVISLKDDAAKWLFLAGDNITLKLNNITLKGHDHNRAPLVVVIGTLVMKGKSKIIENTNTIGGGCVAGGVWVRGTFIQEDGEISGNTFSGDRNVYNGAGGVYVASYGTFTMNGGKISGNSAGTAGGGVNIDGQYGYNITHEAVFTMNSGEISGNNGGGVTVNNGSFTLNGGKISGNSANTGGGVNIGKNGTFTMYEGGEISGNTVGYYGGGAYVNGGTFNVLS